jgi:hypothetical protein
MSAARLPAGDFVVARLMRMAGGGNLNEGATLRAYRTMAAGRRKDAAHFVTGERR